MTKLTIEELCTTVKALKYFCSDLPPWYLRVIEVKDLAKRMGKEMERLEKEKEIERNR